MANALKIKLFLKQPEICEPGIAGMGSSGRRNRAISGPYQIGPLNIDMEKRTTYQGNRK